MAHEADFEDILCKLW